MVFTRAQHRQKQTLRGSQSRAAVRAGIEPSVALGILFVALMAFCVSPEVSAIDPSSQGGLTTGVGTAVTGKTGSPKAPDWTDPNQYSECGQDCLYQKGNENISLQALYQVNKINNIQNILNDTTFTPDDYGSIMGEMAPYCPDVDTNKAFDQDASYNDANKCYQRYLQVQIPILKKMKAAIVHNDDAAGQLQTNQRLVVQSGFSGGAGGQKVSVFATPQDGKPKKPQTPEFQTEDELLSTSDGQKKLQLLASESYARWATEQMANAKPQKEDYVLTVDVPRDPKNPSSEMITRILRNPDGRPKLDNKAFLAAQAAYDAQSKGTPTDESIIEMAKDPKYANPKLTMGHLDPVITQKGFGKNKAPEYLLDRISYEQARNQAVAATTDLLRKQGVLGGGASRGAKGAIASAAAAAKNKSTNKIDPASEFGAKNVLRTPVGPGIDKKGNLVQPAVQPNMATNGDYTVSFKPSELGKTTDDMQKNLTEIKADEEAIFAGKTPPSSNATQTATTPAGSNGTPPAQNAKTTQNGDSGTSDGSGSGANRGTAGSLSSGDSRAGSDKSDGGLTMPAHPDGSMQEQGSYENPTSAAPQPPVQQPD